MINRVTMQDIQSALREATAELAGSVSSRLDAEVLLAHVLDLKRADLYRCSDRILSAGQQDAFRRCIERRKNKEPVAYITGWKEFWSLPFRVNRHVLIPRPETEILVEEALRICRDRPHSRILEVGTGSGAIATALASTLPDLEITATDISGEALGVASENAALNGVKERINFLEGDLYAPVRGRFDMIVSNPPYVSEDEYETLEIGVRGFEPVRALVAGPEGTEFHEKLIAGADRYLNPDGWLIMEIGAGQQKPLEALLTKAHFTEIGFIKDYAGFFRVVIGRKEQRG